MENANKNGNMKQNEDLKHEMWGNGIRGRMDERDNQDDGPNG